MSLEQNLKLFAEAVGADIGALIESRGSLGDLTTTAKANLVQAINELQAEINNTSAIASALIDNTASYADKTYSSDKINTLLTALKADILGGAPEAFDTLKEIADYLAANDGALAALLTSINNRVSFAEEQVLTTAQKKQACDNIGIGDPEVNLVAAYSAAKIA